MSRNNFQQDVKIKELMLQLLLYYFFLIRDLCIAKYFPVIFIR